MKKRRARESERVRSKSKKKKLRRDVHSYLHPTHSAFYQLHFSMTRRKQRKQRWRWKTLSEWELLMLAAEES